MKRTKIVCTIGPASNTETVIEKLIQAGMNVARLNFSHGTHEEHGEVIRTIRAVSERLAVPVAILQDIAGPKIRIGQIENGPVTLAPGDRFVLTSREVPGNTREVSVNFRELPSFVQPGDSLLLADGMLELTVEKTGAEDIECRVITGGSLNSRKGINLPTRSTGIPILTEKDRVDLQFGRKCGVDYVALSFVRTADDVRLVRALLRDGGQTTPLIAKIEKPEALDHLDEILEEVDGIMVARGDLGVELPFERVPRAQKDIIARANRASKPVITATQMLESMVNSPRPTRAEVNDVANAILDGTDAVMLSEESAMGAYPVQAVQAMARIAKDVEEHFPYKEWFAGRVMNEDSDVAHSVSQAACGMAEVLGVAAIVATTVTGTTARQVARFRPAQPILAPTPSAETYRRLALV
ncbi:MAG: pyruvate kinase, partial [Kiritimatiellae bacterium]|nr:pyruvate kinase [Kiritimatiellia bacterium]